MSINTLPFSCLMYCFLGISGCGSTEDEDDTKRYEATSAIRQATCLLRHPNLPLNKHGLTTISIDPHRCSVTDRISYRGRLIASHEQMQCR